MTASLDNDVSTRDLEALAGRCEAAALINGAPVTKELDREIARVLGWHRVEPRFTRNKHGGWIAPEDFICVESDGSPRLDSLHGTTIHRDVPNFTASIDAALQLYLRVPERVPSNPRLATAEALRQRARAA